MSEISRKRRHHGSIQSSMGEVLQDGLHRGKFQPWEIDILLGIGGCNLRGSAERRVLPEYQNAVKADLQKGAHLPLRLSEYLKRREGNCISRKPAKGTF